MQLKKLLVEHKDVWVSYPDIEGFEVLLSHMSRKDMVKMRNACTNQMWDRKARGMVEKLNEDMFIEEFTKRVIKGWRGLKLKDVAELVLMDVGNEDPEQEVEFNEENAQLLIENSVEFDSWVNDVVYDVANFRK